MKDDTPFLDITGDDCTVEDCEFKGNRPIAKTSGKNTRFIRLKHIEKEIKNHKGWILFLITIAGTVIAGKILDYI